GCHAAPEVRAHIDPDFAERSEHLLEAPVDLLETTVHLPEAAVHLPEALIDVPPQVVQALVHVVDALGELLSHAFMLGEVSLSHQLDEFRHIGLTLDLKREGSMSPRPTSWNLGRSTPTARSIPFSASGGYRWSREPRARRRARRHAAGTASASAGRAAKRPHHQGYAPRRTARQRTRASARRRSASRIAVTRPGRRRRTTSGSDRFASRASRLIRIQRA